MSEGKIQEEIKRRKAYVIDEKNNDDYDAISTDDMDEILAEAQLNFPEHANEAAKRWLVEWFGRRD